MSRGSKIFLGVIAGLLVLCVCSAGAAAVIAGRFARLVSQSVVTDPAKTAAVAEGIADYKLPAGYRDQYAMNFFGFSIVGANRADGHIILMGLPAGLALDAAQLEAQAKKATENQTQDGDLNLHPVGTQTAVIRDQQVTLSISEGSNGSNQPYRQLAGVFQGRNGPAFLIFTEPIKTWNQAEVDSFLASIK
jgi:hypothetical protein